MKTILLNRNMEILHIDVTYENEQELDLDDMFEMACFDFPTPFRRGDILVDTDHGPCADLLYFPISQHGIKRKC